MAKDPIGKTCSDYKVDDQYVLLNQILYFLALCNEAMV